MNVSQRIRGRLVHFPAPVTFILSQLGGPRETLFPLQPKGKRLRIFPTMSRNLFNNSDAWANITAAAPNSTACVLPSKRFPAP